jgi:hypothetical protein
MPEVVESGEQLEKCLDELEKALSLNRRGIWQVTTDNPRFEQFTVTFTYRGIRSDLSPYFALAYKGYSDARREIVWFRSGTQDETNIEKDRPVTWEIEDIASAL